MYYHWHICAGQLALQSASNYVTDLANILFCTDETEFRNFIVWLEDQKIRHYKIEDRVNLRNIPSSEWPKSFEQVSSKASYYTGINPWVILHPSNTTWIVFSRVHCSNKFCDVSVSFLIGEVYVVSPCVTFSPY